MLVWYSPDGAPLRHHRARPRAGAVRATVADRDNLARDDTVTIYLDTFNDRRRAFFFTVNPLGIAGGRRPERGRVQRGHDVRRNDATRTPTTSGTRRAALTDERLRRRDPHPVQEPALPGQRAAAMGPQRRSARCSAPATRTPGPTSARQLELPRAGRRHRRPARPEARRGDRGAAVRHRRRTTARSTRAARSSGTAPTSTPGVNLRLGFTNVVARRHGEPRLQPGRVGRRPGDRQRAVRALLRREAAVLPRGHRAVLDAEPARVHAANREPDRRRQVHRQVRPARRRVPQREGEGERRRRARSTSRASAATSARNSIVGVTYTDRTAGSQLQPRAGGRLPHRVQEAVLRAGRRSGGRGPRPRRRDRGSSPVWHGRVRPDRPRLGLQLQADRPRPRLRRRESGYVPRSNIVELHASNRLSLYGSARRARSSSSRRSSAPSGSGGTATSAARGPIEGEDQRPRDR